MNIRNQTLTLNRPTTRLLLFLSNNHLRLLIDNGLFQPFHPTQLPVNVRREAMSYLNSHHTILRTGTLSRSTLNRFQLVRQRHSQRRLNEI